MNTEGQSTRRILILDDTASIHEDFRKALMLRDDDAELSRVESLLFGQERIAPVKWPVFDLVFALQGEEGCRKVEESIETGRPFAVAFVDMRMPPGWDGVETIEKMWKIDPRIQAVVCTAHSDYTWDEVVQRLGISDRLLILKKPFDNSEVLQLATALGEKWLLTGLAQLRMDELEQMVEARTAELRVTEERLRRSEKLEAIGRLAGGIAHDFNNLLTAIKMYAEFLRDETPSGDIRRQDVDNIVATADRAAALTAQLLAIGGAQLVRPQVVDLIQMVTAAVPMLQHMVSPEIALTIMMTPTERRIKVDPTQIEQVLLNLVMNARDAIAGSGTIAVEVRELQLEVDAAQHHDLPSGWYLVLQVTDTGAGVEDEIADRVFDPFFTTKKAGAGMGLGLSSAYGIVKQAGGSMSFTTAVGRGTVFSVYLPATDEPVAPPEVPLASARSGAPETILVVDDELAVRSVTRRALERTGYRVIEAGSGPEALRLLEEAAGPVDLILTDVVMPDMDGTRFVELAIQAHGPMRTIFMSGYTEDAATRGLLASPNTAFLLKPFRMNRLLQVVRSVLDVATTR